MVTEDTPFYPRHQYGMIRFKVPQCAPGSPEAKMRFAEALAAQYREAGEAIARDLAESHARIYRERYQRRVRRGASPRARRR
jgi:hypothetical protein